MQEFKRRSKGCCVFCGKRVEMGLNRHHITLTRYKGEDEENNYASNICQGCHFKMHAFYGKLALLIISQQNSDFFKEAFDLYIKSHIKAIREKIDNTEKEQEIDIAVSPSPNPLQNSNGSISIPPPVSICVDVQGAG